MATDTLTTLDPKAVTALRTALAEWAQGRETFDTAHFESGLETLDTLADRVRPTLVTARETWTNQVKGRKAANYRLQSFIDAASAVDGKYKGFTAGSPERKRLTQVFNYCLMHDDAAKDKYLAYSLGAPDLDAYLAWLPSAANYGKGGALLPTIKATRNERATKVKATAAVLARTSLSDIEIGDLHKDVLAAVDKCIELRKVAHDCAQAEAAIIAANGVKLKEVNDAWDALVASKLGTKIRAEIAKLNA